mmetsp:Transcript_1003/g.2468  ORF Transcript_1003/g.2468 Transcript_1003/m.2468 type:complete len:280 (-) Transcript_1003:1374-2213(-)
MLTPLENWCARLSPRTCVHCRSFWPAPARFGYANCRDGNAPLRVLRRLGLDAHVAGDVDARRRCGGTRLRGLRGRRLDAHVAGDLDADVDAEGAAHRHLVRHRHLVGSEGVPPAPVVALGEDEVHGLGLDGRERLRRDQLERRLDRAPHPLDEVDVAEALGAAHRPHELHLEAATDGKGRGSALGAPHEVLQRPAEEGGTARGAVRTSWLVCRLAGHCSCNPPYQALNLGPAHRCTTPRFSGASTRSPARRLPRRRRAQAAQVRMCASGGARGGCRCAP